MQQMVQESSVSKSVRCYTRDKLLCNGNDIWNLVPHENSQSASVSMGKACFPIEIHHQFLQKYGDSIMVVQHD